MGVVKGCDLVRALKECGRSWGERLLCDCNNFSHSGFLSGGPWFFSPFWEFSTLNSCVVVIVFLFL